LNPREFVEHYYVKSLVASFSGGKDSLASTHYVLSVLDDLDIYKQVVYVDTTVMIPGTTEFVKDVCAQFGWPLTILQPKPDFWTMVREGKPMPSMRRRWCCFYLKLKPIRDFVRDLNPQRAEVTGLRRDESPKRASINEIFYLKTSRVWKYAPICTWTEKDVLDYMTKHGLPMPPHYRLGLHETCLCGAFSSKREMMIVKARFPRFFDQFLELEKDFKKGGAAFFFHNKPTYARDLKRQKTIEEF